MPSFHAIFFIGPQGSGKGTQARLVAERLNYYYWEMGGILRALAKTDTPMGRHTADIINVGNLLEDEDLIRVFEANWPYVPRDSGVVFDGVPRTLRQAELLLGRMLADGCQTFRTVYIDVPREESVKRLLDRAHHEFRVDDTEEFISRRLQLYEDATKPVLDYLKQRGEFLDINGVGDIAEITTRINRALKI